MTDQNALIKYYGVMTQPYGNTWPELKTILMTIYRDRVYKVPWLPSDWLDTIETANDISGNVVVIVPSSASYPGGQGAVFLDTPEKKAWWNELASASNSAVQKYAKQKASEGKQELDRLYAASDFWSRAYDWAVILASPVTAVRTIWNNPYATAIMVGSVVGGLLLLKYLLSGKKNR
jgi:sensor c-di-GMP phosphodiesterase-like protein